MNIFESKTFVIPVVSVNFRCVPNGRKTKMGQGFGAFSRYLCGIVVHKRKCKREGVTNNGNNGFSECFTGLYVR